MGDETRRKFFGSLVSEDVEEALAAALDIHEENPKEAAFATSCQTSSFVETKCNILGRAYFRILFSWGRKL